MRIRDEELVQFLLGDADPTLRQRVEASLTADPRISKRLEELRAALGLLDSLQLTSEPPEDLVSRTLMRIDADIDANIDDAVSAGANSDGNADDCEVPLRSAAYAAAHAGDALPVHSRRPSNSIVPAPMRANRQLWDSAILSLSIVAICCLMLPLMMEARSQSRRIQCAYNLNSIGRGLTEMAMLDSERRFPCVPASGPESFAGINVMRLHEAKLLDSTLLLKCPGLPEMVSDAPRIRYIPSREEFIRASAARRQAWRHAVGGDYAYTLGVVDDGRITGARLEGRTHFAIVGDAPRLEDDQEAFVAHEGYGVNIYFEDGHVAFVPVPRIKPPERSFTEDRRADRASNIALQESLGSNKVLPVEPWLDAHDDPFRNTDGAHACGLNPNDAVLGPSYLSPLPRTANLR